jgi:hypothetical protein
MCVMRRKCSSLVVVDRESLALAAPGVDSAGPSAERRKCAPLRRGTARLSRLRRRATATRRLVRDCGRRGVWRGCGRRGACVEEVSDEGSGRRARRRDDGGAKAGSAARPSAWCARSLNARGRTSADHLPHGRTEDGTNTRGLPAISPPQPDARTASQAASCSGPSLQAQCAPLRRHSQRPGRQARRRPCSCRAAGRCLRIGARKSHVQSSRQRVARQTDQLR